MSDEPKEIESLNQEDLNVEDLTPEELEQVSGGEVPDCGTWNGNCGTYSHQ